MGVRAIIFRLAALLVLLSSASDYFAYDLCDPGASMSSAGPELLLTHTAHAITLPLARTTDLPDDHCLCCSPSIAPQSVIVEPIALISSAFQCQSLFPPLADRQVFKLPPRS
jgi:hypothetical protein